MAVKIKICGIMRVDDAAQAVVCGGSYLGVVFAGGPRAVSPDQAKAIVVAAAGVPVLGVFAGQSVDEILEIASQTGLRGAQLHGSYSGLEAVRLQAAGLQIWRVVRIAAPHDLDDLSTAVSGSDAVLVEPRVPQSLGGAGVPLDLGVAREARDRLAGHPMALAGGLTPETVGEALERVHPDIVDVSSGVERLPGIKDHEKIVRFVEAVFAHSPVT